MNRMLRSALDILFHNAKIFIMRIRQRVTLLRDGETSHLQARILEHLDQSTVLRFAVFVRCDSLHNTADYSFLKITTSIHQH
ncbi:hypothetical protein D3C76_1044330 [compost metagenome]